MVEDSLSNDPIAKTFLAILTFFCIMMVLREDWVIWVLSYGRSGPRDMNQVALRITRTISVVGSLYGTVYILWNFISK